MEEVVTQRQRGEPMTMIKDPLTGEVKQKGVSSFTEPQGTPLVSAASYSKRVEERRQKVADAKSVKTPLGHAPPIPEGKLAPIVESARRLAMPQPDFSLPPVDPPPDEGAWDAPSSSPPPPPPLQGVGAGYAVNQALSKGELERPVSMREAARLVQKQAKPPEAKKMTEAAYEEAPEVPDDSKSKLEAAEKELSEPKTSAPLFDFEALQRARIPLMSDVRRKAIEERLEALNFEDLITKREINQNVAIIPGKFTVGYRTTREMEYLWVLQYLYETGGVASAAYMDELNSMCRLVCAIRSINGKLLPDHRDNVGQPNEEVNKEKFRKKLDIVLGFPTHVVADMGVNFNWFSDRVAALFNVENLKNG